VLTGKLGRELVGAHRLREHRGSRAPPSDVKSFWYSMSTTAVVEASMGM
jgi:hypothetical protein